MIEMIHGILILSAGFSAWYHQERQNYDYAKQPHIALMRQFPILEKLYRPLNKLFLYE